VSLITNQKKMEEANRFILTFDFSFASCVTSERKKNFFEKFFFLLQQPLPWILQSLPLHPFASVKPNLAGVSWCQTESKNVMQCLTFYSYDEIHTTMKVFFFMLVGASRIASFLQPFEVSFHFHVLALPLP
jgi:hypothetical protein